MNYELCGTALKSLAKQVCMPSKLGDTTASYIVNDDKCKMLLMWQMLPSGKQGILFWYSSIEFLIYQMALSVTIAASYI